MLWYVVPGNEPSLYAAQLPNEVLILLLGLNAGLRRCVSIGAGQACTLACGCLWAAWAVLGPDGMLAGQACTLACGCLLPACAVLELGRHLQARLGCAKADKPGLAGLLAGLRGAWDRLCVSRYACRACALPKGLVARLTAKQRLGQA
jgi:hypothetical protein